MKRALVLLAPAVLAIGLVACGDDDDDSPDTTTATVDTESEATTASTSGTSAGEEETSGSIPDNADDQMAELFPSLSEEQIDCLIDEVGDAASALDPDQAQAVADACDIDPADFADINTSALSIPDNFGEIIAQAFPRLDEGQIDCLLEQLGPELDISQAAQLADTCDIDPADLQPGG